MHDLAWAIYPGGQGDWPHPVLLHGPQKHAGGAVVDVVDVDVVVVVIVVTVVVVVDVVVGAQLK